jgi:DNA sulfur modification protein DndB
MELKKNSITLPALRGVIGDWVYYASLMSAEQVSRWVKSAKDIREAKSLDEVLQRDLNERKKQIAKYLLKTDSRFFNSIIVGVYGGLPDWIEFDISKRLKEIGSNYNENIVDSMGLLVFNGDEEMFAIDGQHRVAGLDIAINDDMAEAEKDRVLTDDTFSVIFIAHVDDDPGRKRTRKLFSDINKNAKAVATSDRIVIDEEDLAAIVTRRIYGEYKYFENGRLIDISPKSNIDKDNIKHFTNLDNLYKVCKVLKGLCKIPRNTVEWEEKNILTLEKINEEFFNFVIENVEEYKDYFVNKTKSLSVLRDKNKYLLFRPIGLTLLAKLYVYFKKKDNMVKLIQILKKVSFVLPESPYNKILWVNGKMQATAKNQNLAYNLTLYMFYEFKGNKEELLVKYREITKNEKIQLPKQSKTRGKL